MNIRKKLKATVSLEAERKTHPQGRWRADDTLTGGVNTLTLLTFFAFVNPLIKGMINPKWVASINDDLNDLLFKSVESGMMI